VSGDAGQTLPIGERPPLAVLALLAAGQGTRYEADHHKLDATLPDGRTVLDHAVESIRIAAATLGAPAYVVTGAATFHLPTDVTALANPDWHNCQASSLGVAIEAARHAEAAQLIVGLGDQPFITPETWITVATAPTTRPIVVATYGGRRGNPVRLSAQVWSLLPTDGDEGARALMRLRPELVGEVPCSGSPADIDTVEDLQRWQSN
jgi:CTP:molybdopterin cytidylyltransferase MocA